MGEGGGGEEKVRLGLGFGLGFSLFASIFPLSPQKRLILRLAPATQATY